MLIFGCVSFSVFACLVFIAIGSVIGLKIYVITAVIKKYKANKEKYKKVLLGKSKLNSVEVLISNVLIYSNISYDEFLFKKMCLKNTMIRKKTSKIPMTNKVLNHM